jgi:hypothetical protein
MTRLCERPGCSAPAEVAYGFDPDRRLVWLDATIPGEVLLAGALCRRHADAMVVPRGWTLDDRRDPSPRLFRPPAPSVDDTASTARPRRSRRPARHRPAELFDEVAEVPDPDETVAIPWTPQFDHADDLGGLLDAGSPLLARAFRGTTRRRPPD